VQLTNILDSEYFKNQRQRTVNGLDHLIECASFSKDLTNQLVGIRNSLSNSISALSESDMKSVLTQVSASNACVDCAVAIIQTSKVVLSRQSQIHPMKLAKEILSNRQDVFASVTESKKDLYQFRTCLLGSKQHSALFLGFIYQFIKIMHPKRIRIEYSLENDWKFWNEGIPEHRFKLIIQEIVTVFPTAVRISQDSWMINNTWVQVCFTHRSRVNFDGTELVNFRLEDDHPILDIAVDGGFIHREIPTITITCRAKILIGRNSHVTLVRNKHVNLNQFFFVPPNTSQALFHEQSSLERKRRDSRLIIASIFGQLRLNRFFTSLSKEETESFTRFIWNPEIEKIMLVGSSDSNNLQRIIESKFEPTVLNKFTIVEHTPIQDLLPSIDLFLALPIDGGGTTARMSILNGVPVLLCSSVSDISLILQDSHMFIENQLGKLDLGVLAKFSEFEDKAGFISELLKVQRQNLRNASNPAFLLENYNGMIQKASEIFQKNRNKL
jgi:hypothetical protein